MNHSPLPIVAIATQWLLLVAAATFGALFAYNVLSPISAFLGLLVAFAVMGLNFAEGYLVRFAVAGWRFGFARMALLSFLGALLISAYSLLAGFNVIQSYLVKNQNEALATDYEISAARHRIQAEIENNLFGINSAESMNSVAAENEKIAALLRNKPADLSSVSPSTAATLIAIALEAAIMGLTAFIELFLRPTPLPALVKFNNKLIDWGLNENELKDLSISASPAPGTVSLPKEQQNRPERVRTRGGGGVPVQVEVGQDYFQDWLELIKNRQIKPTVKETKQYLRQNHQYKMEDAQREANEYLERAYNLGYLDLNDDKGAFSSQYVLTHQKLLG